MENIIVSLNIVAPIFLMIAAGFLIRRLNVVNDEVFDGMNKLVVKLFLPALLFYNAYKVDFSRFGGKTLAYVMGSLVVSLLLFFIFVTLFVKDNGDRSVIIHALMRGNSAVYGSTIAIGLLGETEGADAVVVISFTIIFYNIMAPVIFAVFQKKRGNPGQIVLSILKNPMFVGCVIGLLLSVSGLRLPEFAVSAVKSLSNVATPVAFVCLGASLTFSLTAEHLRILAVVIPVRLVVMPLVWLFVGVKLFNLTGVAAITILTVFATPVAVSTYPFAKAYGANDRLAAEIVLFSTVASVFTLFLFIAGMKQLAIF